MKVAVPSERVNDETHRMSNHFPPLTASSSTPVSMRLSNFSSGPHRLLLFGIVRTISASRSMTGRHDLCSQDYAVPPSGAVTHVTPRPPTLLAAVLRLGSQSNFANAVLARRRFIEQGETPQGCPQAQRSRTITPLTALYSLKSEAGRSGRRSPERKRGWPAWIKVRKAQSRTSANSTSYESEGPN
jgi:hypothetical protein